MELEVHDVLADANLRDDGSHDAALRRLIKRRPRVDESSALGDHFFRREERDRVGVDLSLESRDLPVELVASLLERLRPLCIAFGRDAVHQVELVELLDLTLELRGLVEESSEDPLAFGEDLGARGDRCLNSLRIQREGLQLGANDLLEVAGSDLPTTRLAGVLR